MAIPEKPNTRRAFLAFGVRCLGVLAAGGAVTALAARAHSAPSDNGTVWQIDPTKCVQCGKCATECVLTPSAVKCVHNFKTCGYCKLCFGFFDSETIPEDLTGTAAEFQRCPTDAITRRYLKDEGPFFEYKIDEARCIGCGLCVKGCNAYGNGSLFLQIRHPQCVNCNQCAIATACPAQAISRVPVAAPYNVKERRSG